MDRILKRYDLALQTQPVRTKAMVGFIMSAVGNAMGQYRSNPQASISSRLVLLFALRGTPPFSHWWFNWLDRAVPDLPVLGRLALDQLLWRPLLVLYSFVAMGLLEGKTRDGIVDTLRSRYKSTVAGSLRFGVVTQIVNLKLVPLRWRTTFWECASLFWNIYLTLQMKKEEDKKKVDEPVSARRGSMSVQEVPGS